VWSWSDRPLPHGGFSVESGDMFWTDRVVTEIKQHLAKKIASGEALTVRDEKTASGRVHVGAMRTVSIHGLIAHVLKEHNIQNVFRYEINDFDAFDTVPSYVPSSFDEHLGKPLSMVPSPQEGSENYARFFGEQYLEVVRGLGIEPEVYYSSEQYKAGKYNDAIKVALENADKIREIYKKVSGGEKEGEWLPIMMICESCGKVATTRPVESNGEQVAYVCDLEASGAKGCGYEGKASPFDGNAKLPWKVEWAAKFKVFSVDVEGEGKDLATKGGARDVANHISREVFKYEPPYDVPHEFFLIGGKKMSTSKGTGASAVEVNELMPRKIFMLALIGKEPKRAFDFDPQGNTLPLLYDRYDEIAEKYWDKVGDDEARLYELVHLSDAPERYYRMRFSQVAFLAQMPHIDIFEEAQKEKGDDLNEIEKGELHERVDYALAWIKEHAPERYVFELQEKLPEVVITGVQKEAFRKILEYVEANEELTGEGFHQRLHEIKSQVNIDPKELFSGLYQVFLNRDSGPQAGWFLSVLPRDFLVTRLREIAT